MLFFLDLEPSSHNYTLDRGYGHHEYNLRSYHRSGGSNYGCGSWRASVYARGYAPLLAVGVAVAVAVVALQLTTSLLVLFVAALG